jgi:hypothetical protein
MRDNIEETSVVLAPDLENTCIPAYSAKANVVSLRGGLLLRVLPALQSRAPGRIEVPQGTLDVRNFLLPLYAGREGPDPGPLRGPTT